MFILCLNGLHFLNLVEVCRKMSKVSEGAVNEKSLRSTALNNRLFLRQHCLRSSKTYSYIKQLLFTIKIFMDLKE